MLKIIEEFLESRLSKRIEELERRIEVLETRDNVKHKRSCRKVEW